jgi:hypothetical protein
MNISYYASQCHTILSRERTAFAKTSAQRVVVPPQDILLLPHA